MMKDWTELLRDRLESYTPDTPQISFEELKQKMLAAGGGSAAGTGTSAGSATGAGAGAGAPKGASVPMKRGLKWVAAAASLAAVVAGGALLLRNRGDEPHQGLAEAVQQEVVAVEKASAETAPAVAEIEPVNEALEAVSNPALTPVLTPNNNNVTPSAAKPVTIANKGTKSLLADTGKSAENATENAAPAEVVNAVPAAGETPVSDTEKSESKAAGQESDPASESTYNNGIADLGSDPFAEPVEPVRKQIKRFSLGASGILAANASARNDKASPNDLSVTTDRMGNKYFDFGAPEIQYHYTAPVSGGISLRYNFTNQFYAETGLRFTYLRTWVTPTGARQNLLFAGIPVGLGAKFARLGNFDLYGSAYGMGSKCIYGSETSNYPSNYTSLDEIPLMWSVGISPGAEYHITPLIGLYAEPTLSYYFKNEKAPSTLYKDNPLYFTVNVGVRFNM